MIKLNHSTVFIIGGFQNDIISNRTWIADPLNGFEMIEGPTLNVERYGHSCGKMISNGKIVLVVAGGRDQFRYLESIEILDPSSGKGWIIGTFNNIVNFSHLFDSFILGPSLPFSLYGSTMVTSADGHGVIVMGGYNDSSGEDSNEMFEVKDINFGTWALLPQKLHYARVNHLAIPLNTT